jgi:hypothetical protein
MTTRAVQERDLPRLEAALAEHAGSRAERVSGPVTVLSSAAGNDGTRSYEVSASVLLPVDEHDPALREVSIPLPVTATVELDRKGSVVGVAVPPVDPASAGEARAYARSLIQAGAVKGLPPSGRVRRSADRPVRPTHELKSEANGAKVIRRSGYSIAG